MVHRPGKHRLYTCLRYIGVRYSQYAPKPFSTLYYPEGIISSSASCGRRVPGVCVWSARAFWNLGSTVRTDVNIGFTNSVYVVRGDANPGPFGSRLVGGLTYLKYEEGYKRSPHCRAALKMQGCDKSRVSENATISRCSRHSVDWDDHPF